MNVAEFDLRMIIAIITAMRSRVALLQRLVFCYTKAGPFTAKAQAEYFGCSISEMHLSAYIQVCLADSLCSCSEGISSITSSGCTPPSCLEYASFALCDSSFDFAYFHFFLFFFASSDDFLFLSLSTFFSFAVAAATNVSLGLLPVRLFQETGPHIGPTLRRRPAPVQRC